MSANHKLIWGGMAGLLVVGGLVNAFKPDPQPQARKAPAPVAAPARPVSEECNRMVKTAEMSGLVRAGTVDRTGAIILTDRRWAALDANLQEQLAVCLSHYMAGSQDKWANKLTFRNQAAGVTYGTIENTRYRVQN